MLDNIGGVTPQLVSLALDVAALRQQVIANNIANANTPGFRPQRVRFEQILDQAALLTSDRPGDASLARQVGDLRERLAGGELIEASGEQKVALDMEMAKLAENVLRYQALLEGLGKRGSIVKLAVTEGR